MQAPSISPGLLQITITFTVCVSVMLYDALLTLNLELEHVWRQCWTASKALYLLCRYFFLAMFL
ncbi:hypothetical protein AN958_02069 [Leucoagaricus sp. SymC.cos]|nr:hypothetical protein AN958_02069 [Leucoagaricus sp. SymC.cos]